MCDMHCARPDVTVQYVNCQGIQVIQVLNLARILGYLKRIKTLGLFYINFSAILEGYTDASWIISASDNKSTSGWVFTLGGGAVSWVSKKQTCIMHSTTE